MWQDKYKREFDRIRELKEMHNAIILAHYYQRPEIQEIADYVGDSFGLSRTAAQTDAEVIVFCGVHFMAESAAILSPDKKVILPEKEAGCPMADMVTAEELRAVKKQHPDAAVVAYVNTSAAVKAESYVCCTSSNAVKVVESLSDYDRIIFVPDRNLGRYVAKQTGKEVIVWEGYCNTHDRLTPEQLRQTMAEHPEAKVVVHPECRPEVVDMADFVSSTAGMLRYAAESEAQEFIVATEMGLLHAMQKQNPGKRFYLAGDALICPNMKLTTIDKLIQSLETQEPVVTVPPEIAERARLALDRMLAVK